METIFCKIKRFDGTNTWYQDYQVPYEKGKTVVWLLTKIREEQDVTLSFGVSCLHAICGACGVRINGSSYLTCNTPLDRVLKTFKTNELTFEPLANFRPIKDLIVEWEPKVKKMETVTPWIEPTAAGSIDKGFKQSAKEFKKISSAIDCILCGVCSSECQQLTMNDGTYLDPYMFNKAYRFAADTRDGEGAKRMAQTARGELWKCVNCQRCTASCPKGIDVAEAISYLRSGYNCS